jgi:hypothetical protein
MSKISNDKLKFLDKISDLLAEYSGRDTKLDILTQEHWRLYSSHWINLIISINKNVFEIDEEEPLDGLKGAFLSEDISANEEKNLLTKFMNLTENWDDIFGSSYYEIRASLFDFVFSDTVKILEALSPFVTDSNALLQLIAAYKKSMRKSNEN